MLGEAEFGSPFELGLQGKLFLAHFLPAVLCVRQLIARVCSRGGKAAQQNCNLYSLACCQLVVLLLPCEATARRGQFAFCVHSIWKRRVAGADVDHVYEGLKVHNLGLKPSCLGFIAD